MSDTNGDLAASWDAAYSRDTSSTSRYEPTARMSVRMRDRVGVGTGASVVDVGGGTSPLPAALLARGHCDITVVGLSAVAVHKARARLLAQSQRLLDRNRRDPGDLDIVSACGRIAGGLGQKRGHTTALLSTDH